MEKQTSRIEQMVGVVENNGFDKENVQQQQQPQKQKPMAPPPSALAPGQQQPEGSDTTWGLGSQPPDLQDGDIQRGLSLIHI